ncbi:hypothetical protein CLAFUW4_02790 [Fulvia fulva]|uniref:DUF7730 domain-containing protein n=1 Tax=Passalora fulva TaxID=5499 RepID=A0A9Q8LAI6_PASFU|nr:uncharacterized protein CLAFUR5_02777 [Fulvia fulva]KAK4632230.1 hypothetical protein CLAFUR4_02784 [Fulvia fulva]KAK4633180.1 hypothetical protein CLAFUR0_02786 [Fulvia fulva]UJO13834.1 hypothetical protein CLAFUR5_02777 [Fulvia fulva]WPV11459.1 hypothetical protein CLAFUW4_02790 [Fulvia fulva]WPV25670.1 hypothetical protein CLAFUW7_02788 [Fulvia fulva]
MARTIARRPSQDDDEYPQQAARNQTRTLLKPPVKFRMKKNAAAAERKRLDAAFGLGPRPKTKRVAKDILSTPTVFTDLQAVYEKNSTQSRLLKLPSEIRNHIFQLVFGSNTIHVYSKNKSSLKLSSSRQLIRAICANESTEDEDAEAIGSSHETQEQLGYHERHSKCKHYMHATGCKSKNTMNLQLLGVCRQIHEEVALMPYEQSTFSFAWILDLEAFLEHLIPTQLSAVQKLTFI